MIEMLKFRLKARKKNILKLIISICLVSLIFSIILTIPQILEPRDLEKTFNSNISMDEDIENYQTNFLFDYYGRTNQFNICSEFNNYAKEKIHSYYNELDNVTSRIYFFDFIEINNSSSGRILGMDSELFNSLSNNLKNLSDSENLGILLLSNQANVSDYSNVTIEIENQEDIYNFKILHYINHSYIKNNNNEMYRYIIQGPLNSGQDPILLVSIDQFEKLFENKITNKEDYPFFFGYSIIPNSDFTDLVWNKDSTQIIKEMAVNLLKDLKIDYDLLFIQYTYFELSDKIDFASVIIGFFLGFMSAIQIIFILLSSYIFLKIIDKYLKQYKGDDLVRYLSGQKTQENLKLIIFEILFMLFISSLIYFPILYILSKIQIYFINSYINFHQLSNIVMNYCLVFLILFYKYFLNELKFRRIIQNKSTINKLEENDSHFQKFNISIILLSTIIIIITFIGFSNIYSYLFIILLIIGAIVVSFIIHYLIRYLVKFSLTKYQNIIKKRNSTCSPLYFLIKMTKNKIFSRMLAITFTTCLIFTLTIISYSAVDGVTKENTWYNGSDINITLPQKSNNTILELIQNYKNTEDFTIYIELESNFNNTHEDVSISYNILGIDYMDWMNFYGLSNIDIWLENSYHANNFSDNVVFISQDYKDEGYIVGSKFPILFYDESEGMIKRNNYIVGGFFIKWPVITSPYSIESSSNFVIMSKNALIDTCNANNLEVNEKILVLLEDQPSSEDFAFFENQNMFSKVQYINPEIYDGIFKINYKINYMLIQLIIFIIFLNISLNNIENIHLDEFSKKIGIIALSSDSVKIRKKKVIMDILLIFLSIISSLILMIILSFIIMKNVFGLFSFSQETISFISLSTIIILMTILIDFFIENRKYKKIDFSVIFRHTE